MAKLDKEITIENKTLLELDSVLEQQQRLEKPRNYMGVSMIGKECWRECFYDFRNVSHREISASGIRCIQDGYLSEDVMIKRLRTLPFIELHNTDPNDDKKQIGVETCLGHLRGHLDGVIKGILEAPQTWHVFEMKAVNLKKFEKLNKLKSELGEKNALKVWDSVYYSQAVLYMYLMKFTRHYLVCTSPGARDYTSVRTNADNAHAEMLIEKARTLIFDNFTLPARISEKREAFQCMWCAHKAVCHDGDFADVHCKSCRYLECIKDGKRECLLTDKIIDENMLNVGCDSHVYNPTLINARLIEHQKSGCVYKINDVYFSNTNLTGFPESSDAIKGKEIEIFTSKELKEKIKNVNNISQAVVNVVKEFDGTIETEKMWQDGLHKVDPRLKGI